MKKIHNVALGQAGIHRVLSELIIRDLSPLIPVFDIEGVDVMTREGIRIQVKTTRLTKYNKDKAASYNFELRSTTWVGSGKMLRRKRNFSKECEFVILWGVDEDRFWIVPSQILSGKSSIRISRDSRLLKADVPALMADRKAGLSYRELSEKHGFSVQVVWDRLNGNPDPQHGKLVKQVREHESRWDLIEAYVATLSEAKSASAEPVKLEVNKEAFLRP